VEVALGSSGVEVAHHMEADVGVELALDSNGSEVAIGSSGMGWHQAHGGADVEAALESSSVEAVLDSDGGEMALRWAWI
jgi:hypothetical protein